MKNLKSSIALAMLVLMCCSFIEMFNHPSNDVMMFLMFTFTMSALVGVLALKSADKQSVQYEEAAMPLQYSIASQFFRSMCPTRVVVVEHSQVFISNKLHYQYCLLVGPTADDVMCYLEVVSLVKMQVNTCKQYRAISRPAKTLLHSTLSIDEVLCYYYSNLTLFDCNCPIIVVVVEYTLKLI